MIYNSCNYISSLQTLLQVAKNLFTHLGESMKMINIEFIGEGSMSVCSPGGSMSSHSSYCSASSIVLTNLSDDDYADNSIETYFPTSFPSSSDGKQQPMADIASVGQTMKVEEVLEEQELLADQLTNYSPSDAGDLGA